MMQKRLLLLLLFICITLFFVVAVFSGCIEIPLPPPTIEPTSEPVASVTAAPVPKVYSFSRVRTDYRLDVTADGTAVTDKESGEITVVPFGDKMLFNNSLKYSKDTDFIIHHVRSHAETYSSMETTAALPVDFLRTTVYWTWDNKSPRECMAERFSSPFRYPDQPDKAVVSYICIAEFGAINSWDAAFDPAWDLDGDAVIDEGAGPLPDYVDLNVYNSAWKNYVAKYWTESWREELRKKIDLAAVQHFDGVMLDVMTGYWSWLQAYPSMDIAELRQHYVELLAWIYGYAKEQYGSAFLITGNIDPDGYQYLDDLSACLDGGYYQNAFFSWDGSGIVDGLCRSNSRVKFSNPRIEFLRSQGLSVLSMDHLGTGTVSAGLDFTDYDDRITEENLIQLFRWAIDSGSTPFVTQVFMSGPYNGIPRFSRVLPDLPPFTDTLYADWVIGSEDGDIISTGGGHDLVYGGLGDDQIDGGPGDDAAYYTGPRNDYEVIREGESIIVTATGSDDGRDVLINIERLIFSDTVEIIQ